MKYRIWAIHFVMLGVLGIFVLVASSSSIICDIAILRQLRRVQIGWRRTGPAVAGRWRRDRPSILVRLRRLLQSWVRVFRRRLWSWQRRVVWLMLLWPSR